MTNISGPLPVSPGIVNFLRNVHQSIANYLRNPHTISSRKYSSQKLPVFASSDALETANALRAAVAGDRIDESLLQIPSGLPEAQDADFGMASTEVNLIEPIVCRNPGLPFSRIEHFAEGDQRRTLWDLLSDEEFLECLVTMNHGVLPGLKSRRKKWQPGRRPSDIRRAEMTLYRYLARFCSRNDTTGTAGTTIWGKLSDDRTEVIPSSGGKKRVIWASPRHLELLSHCAAYGPLRDRAHLVLFPRYSVESTDLLDRHLGKPMKLKEKELNLVNLVQSGETESGTLSPEEKETAAHLIDRRILTLCLGRPGEDQLLVLKELSHGTALQGDMERLVELREQLQTAREEEFASLMEEADRIASGIAGYQVLDLFRILPFLMTLAIDDPATEIVLGCQMKLEGDILSDPILGWRRLSGRELEILRHCQTPVHSADFKEYRDEILGFLREGVLTLAGANIYRSGLTWEERFKFLSRALAATELSEPLGEAAKLLAAVSTTEPVNMSPVQAEAELGKALGPCRQAFLAHGVDRSFFICDSSRAVQSLAMGKTLRKRLQDQLKAWFRFAGWEEYIRERMMKPTLKKVMGEAAEMPLSRFLEDLSRADQLNRMDPEFFSLREQLIEEDQAKWRLVSHPDKPYMSLEEHGTDPDFEKWLVNKRLVTTMDLMLGGTSEELEAGGGTILVSESHWGSYGLGETTFFPHGHPEHPLQGHGSRIYGDDMIFLQPPRPNKLSAGVLMQMQDIPLGLNNPEGWRPQGQAIPISQLTIISRPDGLVLSDGDKDYNLITDLLSLGNIRAVSAPINMARWECSRTEVIDGTHYVEFYPEIRLGDLIIARSMIQAPVKLVQDSLAGDPSGRDLRKSLSLPRFVFIRTNNKPMLYDFDCLISMEVLAAEAAKADVMILSPMQPTPDELWLTLDDGSYTSELRMAVVCDGENFNYLPSPFSIEADL